jgi:hypothetical protein
MQIYTYNRKERRFQLFRFYRGKWVYEKESTMAADCKNMTNTKSLIFKIKKTIPFVTDSTDLVQITSEDSRHLL